MSDLRLTARDVLLVIDVQNDFCPGGNLAVGEGDQVVPVINRIGKKFTNVAITQDWHPAGHSSFASSHPGAEPFTEINMPYGSQTLWPDHCIQGSAGAEFHGDLELPQASIIVRKGFRQAVDSYSAFFENDHKTPTGLDGYFRERGLSRIFCCGLALDFCVRFSAEDAKRLGYDVIVLEDACRAIDLEGSLDGARAGMTALGIEISTCEQLRC